MDGTDKVILYDRDIREPLFDYLEERFGKTRMFEEKVMGRSRADVLMLTEELIVGLEIKSDADTYERLKRQVKDYDKYCDLNYVVIGSSHARHVAEHIPDHWGILVIKEEKGEILIEELRQPTENLKVKNELQLTFLWRRELFRILDQNKLPKYRQKSKSFIGKKLLEKIEWQALKRQLCEELFERDYTLWNDEMEEAETKSEYPPHYGE